MGAVEWFSDQFGQRRYALAVAIESGASRLWAYGIGLFRLDAPGIAPDEDAPFRRVEFGPSLFPVVLRIRRCCLAFRRHAVTHPDSGHVRA